MKMRHEEVSQILLPPQLAHDLGDGQFGNILYRTLLQVILT
jgi:hypothetical protein